MRITKRISAFTGCVWFSVCAGWSQELPPAVFANLRSQAFKERESAELELLAWGRKQPEPAMRELLRQSESADDPEVRERCLSTLRELVMDEYAKDGDGYIGINMQNDSAIVPGDPKPCSVIRVAHVGADSAGQKAGLKANDLIAAVDGQFWHDGTATEPFAAIIRAKKPFTKIVLKIIREGKMMDVEVILGKRPPSLNTYFFNGQSFDPDAIERADKEAYFRRWLSQRKVRG